MNYDVSADGQRFLALTPVGNPGPARAPPPTETPPTVVLNWQAGIGR